MSRHARRRRLSDVPAWVAGGADPRLVRAGFVLLQLGLLAAIPALAVAGFSAAVETTEGRAVDPELDPLDPGYEAFLETTPVLAVLGTTAEGALSWATLLTLGAGEAGGGSVVFVPVATLLPADPGVEVPEQTLAERFTDVGAETARQGLADALGVGIDEVAELSPDRQAALLEPAAPFAVTNPDELVGIDRGPLDLSGADAVAYLAVTAPGESELSRLNRHELVWRSWLAAVGASTDQGIVPGESGAGVARFVRGVASGPVTYDVPPVTDEAGFNVFGVPEPERFRLDGEATTDLLEDRIPFPSGSRPGVRLRVRVLDGVGADGLTLAAARDVVRAGAQVVLVGNADRFDRAISGATYFDAGIAERVEALAAAYGVEARRLEGLNPDDLVDVTIVVGEDRLAAYGLARRTGPPAGDDPG